MEIKPGKWRLKDGREVVVLAQDDKAVLEWLDQSALWWAHDRFDDAEYLGPAVIGEAPMNGRAYWVLRAGQIDRNRMELEQKCKQLEAETVATRVLLEQSEERCEELTKQLEQPAKSQWAYVPVIPRAHEAETKLASAQCVIEGLEERVRFLEEQAAGMPEVADENGVKVHRFKSVTVMVRGEREAIVRWWVNAETWQGRDVMTGYSCSYPDREEAEAWCREQLEPRWREATEGDVGKACRCKDEEDNKWSEWERLVAVIDHEWKYIAADENDYEPTLYRYCQVQD